MGSPFPRSLSPSLGQLQKEKVAQRLRPKTLRLHNLVKLAETRERKEILTRPHQGKNLMIGPPISA
eukprot:5264187-Amphidinium_carterae.1